MTLPAINSCSACTCGKGGAPSEFITRRDFHKNETLASHMGRRGLLVHAQGLYADDIRKGFEYEAFPETNGDDFRVQCTVGENATGWQHSPHLDDAVAGKRLRDLGVTEEIVAMQRRAAVEQCIAGWNAKNPVK